MCFFSLFLAFVGYYLAPKLTIAKPLEVTIDEAKLKTIATIYTILGCFFFFLIVRTYTEFEEAGKEGPTQATGIITIYFQLYQLVNVAFPILLYLALKKPNFSNIALTMIASFPSLYLIISGGRRETTALFVLSVAFVFFYKYKIVPPRSAIIGIILFAMLIIPATADYRNLADKHGAWKAMQSLDLRNSFVRYFAEGGEYLELGAAAHVIDAYTFTGRYQYGAGYWNTLVFRYVPAQFVGREFKSSLMLGGGSVPLRNGYQIPRGLTITGMGDSFMQFGYLGCIFYFFLGGFFRTLWHFSLGSSSILVHVLYIICSVQALLTVTHSTVNFFPGILFSFVALWIIARFVQQPTNLQSRLV
jgi:hypothetical protein